MKILIVGGAGFIGSHLVDYYLSLNHTVIVVDNLSTGKLNNISHHMNNEHFVFHEANALNWPQLDEVITDCQVIYNLAAMVGMFNVIEHPIATLNININITEKLLFTVQKMQVDPIIIIASSSEVYGSTPIAMKETDKLLLEATNKAHASYVISKLCNEITGVAYFKEKHLKVIIVRIFNTVGPRQSARYGMVLPRFVNQALSNNPVTIFSDGQQTRSFCDVGDLCKILHQLTFTKEWGQIVNAGNDYAISILELAHLVIKLTDSKSELVFQNYEDVYGLDYLTIQNRKPNLDKLKAMIDYQPPRPLEETIRDMIRIIGQSP